MKHYGCNILVRTCEKTYDDAMILEEGIKIIELSFPDGNSPPKDIIKKWLKIVKDNLAMVEEIKNEEKINNEEFKT